MKNETQIKAVYQAMNKFEAETIRIFLESFEMPVELIGESAGTAFGLGGGPLGEVSIYVPADRAEEAVSLIERMQKGEFELPPDKS